MKWRTFFLLSSVTMFAACGSQGQESTPLDARNPNGAEVLAGFGSNDDQCTSAKLTNDEGDDVTLRTAVDCLMTEVDAGQPVVVDLDLPTVEGDSTFHRYHFDGQTVLIVVDDRLDEFGRGAVRAERCGSLDGSQRPPAGVRCDRANHPGFPEAS